MENNTQREAKELLSGLSKEQAAMVCRKYFAEVYKYCPNPDNKWLNDDEIITKYLSEHPQPANQTSTPMEGESEKVLDLKVCKGCGHRSDVKLREGALACCPDSSYIDLDDYLQHSIYHEELKGKFD